MVPYSPLPQLRLQNNPDLSHLFGPGDDAEAVHDGAEAVHIGGELGEGGCILGEGFGVAKGIGGEIDPVRGVSELGADGRRGLVIPGERSETRKAEAKPSLRFPDIPLARNSGMTK